MRPLAAVQPGGASSNFIGPDQLDLRLDFDTAAKAGTMLGSGAMVVMAAGTNLLAAATNVLRFFRNESCGKCVPCRVGSTKAHELLHRELEGGAAELDAPLASAFSDSKRPCARPRSAGSGKSPSVRS